MPYRRLPNTDQARVRALKAAVEKGEMYNVRDLAITLKTLFEARNFLHRFEAAQIYYTQCYDNRLVKHIGKLRVYPPTYQDFIHPSS